MIITDLSPNNLILERFNNEKPRVLRWVDKLSQRKENVIQPAVFAEQYTRINTGICNMQNTGQGYVKYENCQNVGIIPWTSPKTGDTWFAIVMLSPKGLSIITYVYYWETIGSIGFMTSGWMMIEQEAFHIILTFSSHAMLRYRDRIGKTDLTPFQLITWLSCLRQSMAVNYRVRNNRITYELICKEGVFRGTVDNENIPKNTAIVSLNTFLPFEGEDALNKKDAEELKEIYAKTMGYMHDVSV